MGRPPDRASGRPASPDSFLGRASLPPSEWASSEVAASRPAPTPWDTGTRVALLQWVGLRWDSPGSKSLRPPTSLAVCGLSSPRCPGVSATQSLLSAASPPPLGCCSELWAVGEGRHGSGEEVGCQFPGPGRAGKSDWGGGALFPESPVT